MELSVLLLALSGLISHTSAYNQSLAACKEVAAEFRNTCDHGDYDTPATNVSNMTSETHYCGQGFQCFAGATMNNDSVCEWERKLCVTCRVADGVTKIRLQTNNLPDHCIDNKLADAMSIDYEVKFNLHETYGQWIRRTDDQETLDDAVCPINKDYNTTYLGIVEYGDTESERAMGFAINGVAFQFFNSIHQDPVAPLSEDNEQPLDICLGHNQLNSDSGMYHYHAMSPCINETFLSNTSMSECAENEDCLSDVVSWQLSGFSGMRRKTVVGLSKFGHVIYGPYDDDAVLWDPWDVDACNGAWNEDGDEYFYVTTQWHPYGPGCNGPTNFPEQEQLYPNCSTNGIGEYLTADPSYHPTADPTIFAPTSDPTTFEPTTAPTIDPTTVTVAIDVQSVAEADTVSDTVSDTDSNSDSSSLASTLESALGDDWETIVIVVAVLVVVIVVLVGVIIYLLRTRKSDEKVWGVVHTNSSHRQSSKFNEAYASPSEDPLPPPTTTEMPFI